MLILNGKLITLVEGENILEDHAILIEDGKIVSIGRQNELLEKHTRTEQVDAKGQYVMPGSICAHTHFYGAYSRGLGIPGPAPANFPEILERLWWALDKALDDEGVKHSAMVSLVDAVKHGTTTLIDHHASPNAIEGSLDLLAEAVAESGLRASLCYEVTDRDGPARAKAGIAENVRFIERIQHGDNLHGRLSATFGLHASLTLSEETLQACRQACPQDIGFHIHVAEDSADEYDSLMKCGERVVDRLSRHGILGPKTILVHAVHIDGREMDLIRQSGSWVSHQPRSNMNNAVGLPQVESMLRMGIPVCLGNDGFSNTMWAEWKAAYLGHKLINRDPRRMPGDQIACMAFENNRRLVEDQFNIAPVGMLSPGAAADLIFVDYHPFTPLTPANLPWHILFGFHESMVTATLVAGKVLMYQRELKILDEERIAYNARKHAPQIWEQYQKIAS